MGEDLGYDAVEATSPLEFSAVVATVLKSHALVPSI